MHLIFFLFQNTNKSHYQKFKLEQCYVIRILSYVNSREKFAVKLASPFLPVCLNASG